MTISLTKVEAALRAEDLEGLLKIGAPKDEYDSEAKQITAAVNALPAAKLSQASITAIIAFVWAKSFNLATQEIDLRMPAFTRIAQRIHQ